MRFLLGLIIGATATVLLAPRFTSLDIDWPTSGNALPPAVDQVLQAVAPTPEHADENPLTVVDSLAREPLPVPVLNATPPHSTTTRNVGEAATLTPPMLTEISQEQTVWVPFRSEASARGFAGHLSAQLQRPFQVLRAGPGQYLVVFGYQTEPERNDVLDRIRALTGYIQL